ncbi:MAG TPA: hypothetical protein VHV99_28660 [Paraburkholderia sp.]|nr:hypothetical protein [Paraburkholderia sp.]
MVIDSANAFGDYAVKATDLENVGFHISDFSQRYGISQHKIEEGLATGGDIVSESGTDEIVLRSFFTVWMKARNKCYGNCWRSFAPRTLCEYRSAALQLDPRVKLPGTAPSDQELNHAFASCCVNDFFRLCRWRRRRPDRSIEAAIATRRRILAGTVWDRLTASHALTVSAPVDRRN